MGGAPAPSQIHAYSPAPFERHVVGHPDRRDIEGGVAGGLEDGEGVGVTAPARMAAVEDGPEEGHRPVGGEVLEFMGDRRWWRGSRAGPLGEQGRVPDGAGVQFGPLGAADRRDMDTGSKPLASDDGRGDTGTAEHHLGLAYRLLDAYPFVVDLRGVDQFRDLIRLLEKRGYRSEGIEKILNRNFLD